MSNEYRRLQRGYLYQEEQPGLAGRLDIEGWEAIYVGKGIWQILPGTPADRCITMTGGVVTKLCHIPVNHRLVRFEWKHTDGAYADNATATAAIFSRHDYEPGYANLWLVLYQEAASTSSSTVVPWGEGYEYLSCDYEFSFNTTAGHFIFPKLWIQEVKP